jgi:hypothetical protein
MGTALALAKPNGVGDAPSLLAFQRDRLVAFLSSLGYSIDNMVTMFRADVLPLESPQAEAGVRILNRASELKGNIVFTIEALSHAPAPITEQWFMPFVDDGREIVLRTEMLSADMVGLLTDGVVPSEVEARQEMIVFGASLTGLAGLAYYLWWRGEKAAEAEQERALAAGEIYDCGCGG